MKELFSLKQKRFLGGSKEFIVNEDREIVIRDKYGLNFKERSVSIFDLDDKFQVVTETSWFPILMTVCFLGFCGAFFIGYLNSGDPLPLLWTVPWGIAALISLAFFFKGHSKFLVVRFYKSEDIAMLVWRNYPNQGAFETFTEQLKEIIRSTKINPQLSPTEKANYYLEQIAFLEQEGVISEEEASNFTERTIKKAEHQLNSEVISIIK